MRYEIIMTRDVYLKTPKTYTRFDTCATEHTKKKLCTGLESEQTSERQSEFGKGEGGGESSIEYTKKNSRFLFPQLAQNI